MKKFGIAIISLLGILIVSSCTTKHSGPILSDNPGAPSFSAPKSGSSYVLKRSNAQDTLFTMKWSQPNYGFSAAVNYTVQMDKSGDNFSNPIKVGSVNQPEFSITEAAMNSVLLGNGFTADSSAAVQFRVIASISDSVKSEMSKTLPLVLTPYSVCQYCPAIYVPGGYQAASGYGSNWSPAQAPELYNVGHKDQYQGYVYMTNSNGSVQFKLTNDRSWALAWGEGSSSGTLSSSGGNISAPDTGYYHINVDLNAMTYTMKKTSWGIIGSATPMGWNSDSTMTYNPAKQVWTIKMKLTTGDIKFRANHSWSLNYGEGSSSGMLSEGGGNIPVSTAGTYIITLNLSNPSQYTYSLSKQ